MGSRDSLDFPRDLQELFNLRLDVECQQGLQSIIDLTRLRRTAIARVKPVDAGIILHDSKCRTNPTMHRERFTQRLIAGCPPRLVSVWARLPERFRSSRLSYSGKPDMRPPASRHKTLVDWARLRQLASSKNLARRYSASCLRNMLFHSSEVVNVIGLDVGRLPA